MQGEKIDIGPKNKMEYCSWNAKEISSFEKARFIDMEKMFDFS